MFVNTLSVHNIDRKPIISIKPMHEHVITDGNTISIVNLNNCNFEFNQTDDYSFHFQHFLLMGSLLQTMLYAASELACSSQTYKTFAVSVTNDLIRDVVVLNPLVHVCCVFATNFWEAAILKQILLFDLFIRNRTWFKDSKKNLTYFWTS